MMSKIEVQLTKEQIGLIIIALLDEIENSQSSPMPVNIKEEIDKNNRGAKELIEYLKEVVA